MIVCPVCEHAQASGAECEVCGKRLVAGVAGIPMVAALEGLEPTRAADVDAPESPLADLERTHHARADAAPAPATEIEPTAAPPVDVDADALPEVERTEQAGIPDDGPTPLAAAPICRYCRTEAAPGDRVCGRCGMRLPAVASLLEVVLEDVAPPPKPRACPSCGVPAAGPRCPACGGRVDVPPMP